MYTNARVANHGSGKDCTWLVQYIDVYRRCKRAYRSRAATGVGTSIAPLTVIRVWFVRARAEGV